MPEFAYPTPFEFDCEDESKKKKKEKGPMVLTERRVPPSRSKSNDENLFTVKTVMPVKQPPSAQRPMGPKTKSGRHLPKPAPSIPIRGRNPPDHRSVGKTQSSNLEQLQAAARARSSSVPKSTRIEESPEKKPLSLKNLLMKNKSDANSSDELKESLHSQQTSKSSESFKSGSFNFLARKPASTSRTTTPDCDIDRSDHEANHARAKTSNRRLKSSKDQDDDTNTKKDKPKSFKQLLAKTQPNSKSTNGVAKISPRENLPVRKGRETASPKDRHGVHGRAISPNRAKRANRLSPERDLSLSPVEVKKPGSLLTNLLDSLYDSYMDPKANHNDDDDSEDHQKFQSSVSRFDLSLSSLF